MKVKHPNLLRTLTLLLFVAALFICLFVLPKKQRPTAFQLPADEQVHLITLSSPAPTIAPDPIAAFRENRQNAFSALQNALSTIAQASSDPALLNAARDELLRMTDQFETICCVETALCAMGYPDALCAADRQNVTVFFQSPLSESDSLMLCDLIVTWTGLSPSAVLLVAGM